MHHLVIRASGPSALDPALVSRIAELAQPQGLQKLSSPSGAWGERAVRLRDIGVDPHVVRGFMPGLAAPAKLDWAVTRAGMTLGDFRLMVFDMDSTLVDMETLDELGEATGVKARIAEITEAAMRGEIADYAESLRRRVALLEGTPADVLDATYARMRLNPGAETLIEAARAAGLKIMLATGGFTFFAERLQRRLGLDFVTANRLDIRDGRLTGHTLGDIVDAEGKRRALLQACADVGCAPEQAIAMGDGANDLGMLGAAGLGVAFHAKPAVRDAADVAIDFGGLDALLALFEDA